MNARWSMVLVAASCASAWAQPKKNRPTDDKVEAKDTRATDVAAFQRDLDQVFDPRGLTAEAAAKRAAKVAPIVARKIASIDVASADRSKAKRSLYPIVGGKASYTRLSPVDNVVIPLGMAAFTIPFFENNYSVSGQIAINLSDYFVRDFALIGGANDALDAAQLDRKATASAVAQQAREIYYEWLRTKLQMLVAKRQLAQVESTLAQVVTLVEVQRASSADSLRVESQRAQARQIVDRLGNGVALREEQLRLLIGATPDEELAVGEDVREDVVVPELGVFDDLVKRGVSARNELKAIASGISAKEEQRRAEGAALLPRLSAFATVEYADPNPRIFPQADQFKTTWAAGVQLTWVFNESLVATDARQRFAAEANELRADRTGLEQRVRLEVLAAYQNVTLAETAIATSRQGVKAAEESYRVRKDLFAAGRASIVEMVDVETELARARVAALDARIDLRIALAKLAYATGT